MTALATKEETTIVFPVGLKLTGTLVHDRDSNLLVLEDDEGPEHLSTNLGYYGLVPAPGCVFIKDWSEHEGLADAMAQQGLAEILDRHTVGPFNSTAVEVRVLLD